jgi:hypothetical protein
MLSQRHPIRRFRLWTVKRAKLLPKLVGTVICCGIFSRFFCMIGSMQMVSKCEMGVMSSFFVAAAGVIAGGFLVMACGTFMVLRRFSMMVYGFLGHRLEGLNLETQ